MSKKKQKIKNPNSVKVKNQLFNIQESKTIIWITFAGFIIRLIYIIETQQSPFIQNLFSDSQIYFDLARTMVQSSSWFGKEAHFMSPGYTYFLAIIMKFFGDSILVIRILQTLISSVNIFLIYLLTKNLFEIKTANIAAAITALYSIFIFYSGAIFGETLQTFFVTAFLYLLTCEDVKKNKWILTGLMLGLAALFRGNILLLCPVLLIWIYFYYKKSETLRNHLKKAVFYFTIGTAIPVLIITLNNHLANKDFVLLSSNGGINFYLGNNENALGVYTSPKDFDFFKDLAGINYAQKITRIDLTPSEASSYWFKQGLNFITSHPIDAALLTAKKLFLFFDDSENPQTSQININFFRDNYSSILKIPLPNFIFVFLLAVTGMIYSIKKLKTKNVYLMLLVLVAYTLSVIIFFVVGRFRIAITPLLISFAAFGLINLIEAFKFKRFKEFILPAISSVSLMLIVMVLLPSYNYSYADAYSNLGNVYFEQKNINEALRNYNISLKLKETPIAYVLIGNALQVKKDYMGSQSAYENALRLNPNYALAYFNLGSIKAQQSQLDDALKYFSKALEIDPAFAEAYRNKAVIYYMTENFEQSLFNFEKYYSLIKDDNIRFSVQQDIIELRKKLNKIGIDTNK